MAADALTRPRAPRSLASGPLPWQSLASHERDRPGTASRRRSSSSPGTRPRERFSYYGMTSILALYMVRNLGIAEHRAIAGLPGLHRGRVPHADRGRAPRRPVLGPLPDHPLALLRLRRRSRHARHLGERRPGSSSGLGAHRASARAASSRAPPRSRATRSRPATSALLARLYDLYYWMINLGSTVGTLVIPLLLERVSPRGRVRRAGARHGRRARRLLAGPRPLRARRRRPVPQRIRAAGSPVGRGVEPPARGAILRILAIFAPVAAFWALFFQYGSSWTLQADRMRREVLGFQVAAGAGADAQRRLSSSPLIPRLRRCSSTRRSSGAACA